MCNAAAHLSTLTSKSVSALDLFTRLHSAKSGGGVFTVGIDGRSGSGKSSLAQALAACDPRIAVVHTDDLSWHHSFFGWTELLVGEILKPVHAGLLPLRYRPDAWIRRGREGAIDVPFDTTILIVEGVGACRRATRPYLALTVWIEVSPQVGLDRVLGRQADTAEFLSDWHTAEEAYLQHEQPWRHADIIVSGEEPLTASGLDPDASPA